MPKPNETSDIIEIQPLYALSDMPDVVELQKLYWGEDGESIIPAHMLFSIAANGGQVLAAVDEDRVVGAVIGFVGTDLNVERLAEDSLHIYSKRMVVHPDYRSRGLGYQLKMAQRDFALRQGIERVVWTFDPLLAMNAYLNINKLGGICRTYKADYYGTDNTGGLSPLGTSDRLYLEWELRSERVVRRAQGERPSVLNANSSAAPRLLNPAGINADGLPVPSDYIDDPMDEPYVLVEIPQNHYLIRERDASLAYEWYLHCRQTLCYCLEKGYTVVDFVRERDHNQDRSVYVLHREPPQVRAFDRPSSR